MLVIRLLSVFCAFAVKSAASVVVDDPSDLLPQKLFADNEIIANYNVPFVSSQPSDILAAYTFSDVSEAIDHETFSTTLNQTSVILVREGAELNLSYVDVVKSGYSANLLLASFYGFNAAVNVANASVVYFDHINVTTHDGAANIYAYGTDTVAYIENAFLYSSGPVAHGVCAAGNATVYASHISHYSGGNRASSFSGDNPAGYLHVSDSVAHTGGIGSAIFYALGQVYAKNVVGRADRAPVLFSDGVNTIEFTNVDLTAGLLAGTIMFSSAVRTSGATISITDSTLSTLTDDMPGLWFGNIVANASLYNTVINTTSGILVAANFSQVTQDFDYFASYADNSMLAPAIVTVDVAECDLTGDLVAFNSSTISWSLTFYSSWTGTAYSGYGDAFFNVHLDGTSKWTLTNDTSVQNFTSVNTTLDNIDSAGFNVYYNSSAVLNGWLGGETIALTGGGSAKPM